MSDDDLTNVLERLRKENAALKKGAAAGLTMKVSEKGGLSVYGMGRFPITLYKEQWLKLLDMSDEIRTFIAANERIRKKVHVQPGRIHAVSDRRSHQSPVFRQLGIFEGFGRLIVAVGVVQGGIHPFLPGGVGPEVP